MLEEVERFESEAEGGGALDGSSPTYVLSDREGKVREVRSLWVNAPQEAVFRGFSTLGGDRRGWLVWNWAWRLRGAVDRLRGGAGLRRGRPPAEELRPGDPLDFWRVERVDRPRLLRLRAEMRLPGRAWLQWEALPERGGTRLVQTAVFSPRGFWGTAYWYGLYGLHRAIFGDLIGAIAKEAEGRGKA